jgi:hypothetical protein
MTHAPLSVLVVPVPLREIVCGLPGALSLTESVPLRVPDPMGAKVTLIVQFAADARLEPQVSVSPKFVVAAMPAMLSVVVP